MTHSDIALTSEAHGSSDGAGVAVEGEAADGGKVPAVGAGGGAIGATGLEVGGGEGYGHERKQSGVQLHVSYASMYDPQEPQLLSQESMYWQMSDVSSPHVVSLVT
jgi:hypothetical protein